MTRQEPIFFKNFDFKLKGTKLQNKSCQIRQRASNSIEITEFSKHRFLKVFVNLVTKEAEIDVKIELAQTLLKDALVKDCQFLGSCYFETFKIDLGFFFEKSNKKIIGMSYSKLKRTFRFFSFVAHEKVNKSYML